MVPPPICGFQCSALRPKPAPNMASADFCMGLPVPSDTGSTEVALGTHADLPGYDAHTFTLIPVGFTSRRSVQVSGFDDICRLTPPCRLLSASCSSGQRFAFGFLQIRSRPRHPCRSANSSPCRASRGLTPPSECALPGAQKENGLQWHNCNPLNLFGGSYGNRTRDQRIKSPLLYRTELTTLDWKAGPHNSNERLLSRRNMKGRCSFLLIGPQKDY